MTTHASEIYSDTSLDAHHLLDNMHATLESENSSYGSLNRADVPEELLGRTKDINLVRYTIVDWLWIGIFWVGMTYSDPILYPIWALLIGGRIHSFGVTLHDATHKSIRKKNWKMRFVETFAGYPLATTLNAMRYHHIRHHRDSGMESDPYFKPTLQGSRLVFLGIWARHIILMPFWIVRGYYGSAAYFIPSMRNSYGRIFLQEKTGNDLTFQKELIGCAAAEIGQASIHTLLLTATYFYPETVFFYYFIPGIVAGLLAGHRVLVEHNYFPAMDRSIETIIKTTVDHNLGPWGRLFFAPRNIGYHIVHHLHPQVALENLPALRRWYIDNHPDIYPRPYNSPQNLTASPAG